MIEVAGATIPIPQHQWLYLNEFDSASSVRKFVGTYVEQRNSIVPHFVLQGQTPDEMVSGTGAKVPVHLKMKGAKTKPMQLGPPTWWVLLFH